MRYFCFFYEARTTTVIYNGIQPWESPQFPSFKSVAQFLADNLTLCAGKAVLIGDIALLSMFEFKDETDFINWRSTDSPLI